jgi:hypothetical protein
MHFIIQRKAWCESLYSCNPWRMLTHNPQHLGALHEQHAAVATAAQLQVPHPSAVLPQQPRLRGAPLQ